MRDSLHEYFAGINDDDLAVHGIESMAVCAVIHMAAQRAEGANGEGVRALLRRWAQDARHDRPAVEMARMQPLLEELLGEAARGNLEALTPDETTLLFAASALLKMLPATPYYDSVRERLEPLQESLGKLVSSHPPSPTLETLSDRWLLVCPRDLDLSPHREIRKLAGIPIEFHGPVLTVPTRVKMIGSIPDKSVLVVEDGSCCVEGFVQGIVATRGDCIVHENIGGMVVSGEGDIHARKLIDRAQAVAKWGSVYCQETAAPALVFAGRRIAIDGDATRGIYRAHEVTIQGRALGCTIAVSGHAEAARFVHSDRFETAVVLRHEFDANDYGEEIDIHARRKLARATRIKQRQRIVQELMQALGSEVEQDAHTVLLFLAVGDEGLGRIKDLDAAKRRLAALNRVIMGLHQLTREIEENAYSAPWERTNEAIADSLDDSLAAIYDELESMGKEQAEGAFSLEPEVDQLRLFRSQLQQQRSNRLLVVLLLAEWRNRLKQWLAERELLHMRIQQAHRDMDKVMPFLGQPAEGEKSPSAVRRLRDVMADESLLTRNVDIQMRAKSQFVSVMRRNINARLDRLRELRFETRELRAEFERIQEELHATMRLRAADDSGEAPVPTVSGRFDAGVRLCTNEAALETDDAPDTVLITLSKPREEVTTFKRIDTGIVEVE